jgi:shikimate dehydrogenase
MISLGIIGDQRVVHSLSPRMHNAVMAKLGLDGIYARFAVEPQNMAAAVAGVEALGLVGVNVTVPHKRTVLPYLTRLSDEAAALSAVNTIKCEPEGLVGYNTDIGGFGLALAEAKFQAEEGATAMVLGAGGAARSVVLALARGGAQVMVAARKQAQSMALCDELGGKGISLGQASEVMPSVNLLVNTTSVSAPEESPEMMAWMEASPLAASLGLVMDINYGRQQNMWEQLARKNGSDFMDGLPMLAHQARLSFKIWTGIDSPVDDFKAALEAAS